MDISKISPGVNPPDDIHVVIEVPLRSDPVKYEFDKDSGAIFVDRFLYTSMHYPCNYGFVPNTLYEDGDPVDVLVIGRLPLVPGSVVQARPIGVLELEDDGGEDEKILAVPVPRISTIYNDIVNYSDVPDIDLEQIQHFFEHYKDLEPHKWTRVGSWRDAAEAKRIVTKSIAKYAEKG
ncbi:MAG: inorganic diphosphatase [Pseudomonadota bacterium]